MMKTHPFAFNFNSAQGSGRDVRPASGTGTTWSRLLAAWTAAGATQAPGALFREKVPLPYVAEAGLLDEIRPSLL